MRYIHETPQWPNFTWDQQRLIPLLTAVHQHLGRLYGRMEALGFDLREQAVLHTLTQDIVKSSEIEGELLDNDQVRSSVARRLGMDIGGLVPSDRHIDGIVEMMLDATQNYAADLTADRLFGWHACLFPAGRSGMRKIITGAWRDDRDGPMTVVSGPVGRERIHFQAPAAERLDGEIASFLIWFHSAADSGSKVNAAADPVIRAAVAHLWFVTIHPFDDGNGRIARAIADMQLARTDGSRERFYSMSVQIRRERNAYYDILERTQKSRRITADGIDISEWLCWFLECLNRSLDTSRETLAQVIAKARFWEQYVGVPLNGRQQKMVCKLLDGFKGKLTSSKWAKITKCSQDTALRDIQDLIKKRILTKDPGGGRSTSYSINQR